MPSGRIETLVVDSGPFIKGAPLQDWSATVVTVKEVLGEIRDANTRQRLQVLPYDLVFREPSQSAIKHVTEFSKKTGDYASLSAIDLRLIALTYQLECENGPQGGKQLRTEPITTGSSTQRTRSKPLLTCEERSVEPFLSCEERSVETSCVEDQLIELSTNEPFSLTDVSQKATDVDSKENKPDLTTEEERERELQTERKENGKESDGEGDGSDGEGDGSDGEGDGSDGEGDNEGWITPDNLREVCEKMGGAMEAPLSHIAVGCMTTDYAMQNVLLQMGLNVVSIDGLLIKRLQTYAQQCKACFKTCFKSSVTFCPLCGNKAMIKVLAHTGEDGVTKYTPLSQKQFSRRGLRYSLPAPKGGRQPNQVITTPSQKVTFRLPRSRNKPNPLDPDYVALSSPFAFNDVTSRGAQIAFRHGRRGQEGGAWYRNPNQVRKKK